MGVNSFQELLKGLSFPAVKKTIQFEDEPKDSSILKNSKINDTLTEEVSVYFYGRINWSSKQPYCNLLKILIENCKALKTLSLQG